MNVVDGFLVLSKRQVRAGEGAQVYVHASSIGAVEPHRTGSFVYVAGQRIDVGHSHLEIIEAVNTALGRSG